MASQKERLRVRKKRIKDSKSVFEGRSRRRPTHHLGRTAEPSWTLECDPLP